MGRYADPAVDHLSLHKGTRSQRRRALLVDSPNGTGQFDLNGAVVAHRKLESRHARACA